MADALHPVPREVVPLRFGALLTSLAAAPGRAAADARAALREALSARLGLEVALVSSARAGLYWLLEDLGRRAPGGEVALFAYNFFAVPQMVAAAGLTPVFVDAAEGDTHGEPSEEALRAAVGPRTVALLVSHHFGRPSTMERYEALARERGLALFEDCAHAFGSTYRSRHVGSFGEGGVFSLSLTKALCGVAGGVVVTREPAVARALRRHEGVLRESPSARVLRGLASAAAGKLLLDHALFRVTGWPLQRLAARASGGDLLEALMAEPPSPLQAALAPHCRHLPGPYARVALAHLAHVDAERAQRAAAAEALLGSLAGGLAAHSTAIDLPPFERDRANNYLMLPARTREPERLRAFLAARGLDSRRDYLSSCDPDPRRAPRAVALARRGVYLPIRALPDSAGVARLRDALLAYCGPARTEVAPGPTSGGD